MANTFVENALLQFNNLTKKPEKFLSNPSDLVSNIHDSIKRNYDFSKLEEQNKNYNSLRELIVKGFDVEQIWQQIELQNDKLLDDSLHQVCKLVAAKDSLWFNIEDNEENKSDNEENKSDDEESPNEIDSEGSDKEINGDEDSKEEIEEEKSSDEEFEDGEKSDKPAKKFSQKSRESIVDDDFFKLDEMEKFLRNEEREKTKKNNNDSEESDEESVDLFDADDDESGEDEETNPKYSDFFRDDTEEPEEKNNDEENEDSEIELEEKDLEKQSDEESEEEEEIVMEKKSSLEIREERLKKKIEHLEENALKEKSWQLKGEITAGNRPQNSLLEEFVEFDLTTRPAPVITQETTYKLEDVIRQRIKDKAFDSVERKIKTVEAPKEYRKKLVLEEEKSKQSLAQIYEAEYLKQKEALDPEAAEKDEPDPKEHTEIKTLLKSLFAKLDALSNFHFTPRAVNPELKVVNNLPAISMEEVAPVAVSDAALLAPEEIKNKPKGDVIGRGERTVTDKKRERRQKKQKQKKHAVLKEQKDQAAMQNGKFNKKNAKNLLDKVTKDRNVNKMNENSKAVKSSTAFFMQLEEEVKGHIKNSEKRKHKLEKPQFVAKKMKL